MLNLSLIKHTRVYQEAKQEGKEEGKQEIVLEVVPKLLQRGLSWILPFENICIVCDRPSKLSAIRWVNWGIDPDEFAVQT